MAVQALIPPTGPHPIEADEIQGDILVGLQKNAEGFLLLSIDAIPAFKALLRSQIEPAVVYTALAAQREAQIGVAQLARQPIPPFEALNILFSRQGLGKLTNLGQATFQTAFDSDPIDRAERLHDNFANVFPELKADADAILLLTAADEPSVRAMLAHWKAALAGCTTVVYEEIGRVRPSPFAGHEHFGFMDGISQPGVKGLTQPAQPGGTGDPTQGLPGQDLIEPGEFVLGYGKQDGTNPDPPLPWMRNGSFMVLRRMEQKVQQFHSFLGAAALSRRIPVGLMGARFVGRWASGAPVMKAAAMDDQKLADDQYRNNDFDFNADDKQVTCPFISHIRKAYPRDDMDFTTKPGPGGGTFAKREGEAEAEKHRILRRGIPFGWEIGHDPDFGPVEHIGSEASRGLMFVGYQSSLDNAFEFIQSKWCNNPAFVPDKTPSAGRGPIDPGYDLIIGQSRDGKRFTNETTPTTDLIMRGVTEFVNITGTQYFFAPSKNALQTVLS